METEGLYAFNGERRKAMVSVFKHVFLTLGLVLLIVIPNANAQVFSFKWGSSGSGDGEFSTPVGIATDSSGNVYVSDQDNNRIEKFDMNGNFLKKWGSGGTGDGEFSKPRGIAIDSDDNVYVADSGNNRIQKFDSEGNYLLKWGSGGSNYGEFSNPCGVAISLGRVYVTDFFNNRVQVFGSSGRLSQIFPFPSSTLQNPCAIAAVSYEYHDYIAIADAFHRVLMFDTAGTFLFSWENPGTALLLDPTGIAADSSGNVYVSESTNHRVQKFGGDGSFKTKWGIFGFEDGQFGSPSGVAIHQPTGTVYVVDSEKNQIQAFTPPLPLEGITTKSWNYSWTNNRTIDQVGVVCEPEPSQTGTTLVQPFKDNVKITTIAGKELLGFVSGHTINASVTYPESEGISATEIIVSFPSSTAGSGVLRYSWTDNAGSFCTGEADLAFSEVTIEVPNLGGEPVEVFTPGEGARPVGYAEAYFGWLEDIFDGGGGGGGCFIGAAFGG
jgi:DNA-binding beta-propeller fold protein YncE